MDSILKSMAMIVVIISLSLARCSIALQLQGNHQSDHAVDIDAVNAVSGFSGNHSCLSSFATIIASDMRLDLHGSSVDRLNGLTAGTDVFLCTDEGAASDVWRFKNVVYVQYAESVGGIPKDILIENPKLIQWWRLKECYRALERFALEHQHQYTFVTKIRMDVDMQKGVVQMAQESMSRDVGGRAREKVAFIASDYAFGGHPAVMSVIAGLYDENPNHAITDEYKRLNYDLLFQSDWDAGKFDCLRYPFEPIANNLCLLFFQSLPPGDPSHKSNLRDILKMNITGLKQAVDASAAVDVCLGCFGNALLNEKCGTQKFHSEPGIVVHLLGHDILIQRLPNQFTFASSENYGKWMDARIENFKIRQGC